MRIIIKSSSGINTDIEDVDSIRVILSNGYPLSILSNHAPLIARVSAGTLEYKISNNKNLLPIFDSIMIVKNNIIKLLTVNHVLPKII
jgi:F0F1-type ATP synthase epsilon subunit